MVVTAFQSNFFFASLIIATTQTSDGKVALARQAVEFTVPGVRVGGRPGLLGPWA